MRSIEPVAHTKSSKPCLLQFLFWKLLTNRLDLCFITSHKFLIGI